MRRLILVHIGAKSCGRYIICTTYAIEVSWDIVVSIGIKSGTYVCITIYVTHIIKLNLLRYFQVLHSGLEPQSINQLPHRPKDLLTDGTVSDADFSVE